MFREACKIAREFTRPVIISTRHYDGSVQSGCGAYVVLNKEGWIITAAHLWKLYFDFENHKKEIASYEKELQGIQKNPSLDSKRRKKALKRLKPEPKWITNHSFWWGYNKVRLKDGEIQFELDLAIGRLEPFQPEWVSVYPVIKKPNGLEPGRSLCKLGYPFHKIESSFDEKTRNFKLAPGAVPPPLFPMEGIYTRNAIGGKTKDGKYTIKFLETSSPGLRGQSGGPIFDTKGTVWAIQSRTGHYPLGFSPKVKKGGEEIEENQFLNVGLGVHPEVIVEVLKDKGVDFKLSDY